MFGILFYLSALFSVVVGTIAGFGSSTIFLPLALFFVDFRAALVLVAILHISGNVGKIAFFRQGIDKHLLLYFGLPSVLLALIGSLTVNLAPQEVLKLILGLFLLSFSIISILRPDIRLKPTNGNALIGGSLSGFFAGLIGTGGAIRGAFVTSFGLEKNAYIATTAVISFAVDLTRIPVYLQSGFLRPEDFQAIPVLFVSAILGAYIGRSVVDKIPQQAFRKTVFLAIALISVKFILDFF